MERGWWFKFLFLVVIVVMSVLYIIPTVTDMDVEKSNFPVKQKINLGLDLQGGLYMVLGVDFNKVYQEVIARQSTSITSRTKEKLIDTTKVEVVKKGFPVDDPRIQVRYDKTKRNQLYQLIKDEYWNLRITEDQEGYFELALAHSYRSDVRDKTINQSIEVIRNRIDEFGVSEPSITSQGNDRVVVELPGVKDIDRAKSLIGRTARLSFYLVDEEGSKNTNLPEVISSVEQKHGLKFEEGTDQKFSEYVSKLNELAKDQIPKGDFIAFERQTSATGETIGRFPYLLVNKVQVSGDQLEDAQVQFDPETRRPNVGFTLNPKGANAFDKLTGDHVKERLAIVLDNIVHSAPVIQSRISGGRGQISMGTGPQDEAMREAKDLAIVLRAGALPAQLEFLEQRVVGPSLGHDSIVFGSQAGILGAILVLIFIILYYRVSGAIAAFSLVLNVCFVLAILVGLEATLTLPGIAGIALTVGIAVDSNVVIYERIREEILAGKTLMGAVDSGFQKAIRTILDANITNAAAALVLLTYGTGPVKGFAVTMLIGIITTLFTAVFVCRLFFDLYLKRLASKGATAVSI